MDIAKLLQAVVYGIVQGVTEFLPISSSAHLTLLPKLFGWSDGGLGFGMALHLGTGLAVLIYFRKRWASLLRAGFTKPKSPEGVLLWIIAGSTVPAALFGVLLSDKIGALQENVYVIGTLLIVMGLVLLAADRLGKNDVRRLEDVHAKRGVAVGLAQCLAIIPGVSRAGITITAGRLLGVDRAVAAEYTFLLSAPIIFGDAAYHVLKMYSDPDAARNLQVIGGTPALAVGILVSAVVGTLSIKFLLDFLKRKGLAVFAVYRFALGAAILAAAAFGWIAP
ncbi:MAG: undecaprenyl-diphosphatase UppP [Oscillospiraceae bacterium]|nr:undecaprenyl-diphosphatase UppP [Oscillospiraceae bacterium]